MLRLFIPAILIASTAGAAGCGPRHLGAAAMPLMIQIRGLAAATVNSVTPAPSSITFNATDPDTNPVVTISSTVVTSNVTGGGNNNPWTMSVQAPASTLSGCPAVPVSAITVRCTAASDSGSGQAQGSCTTTSATPLSTSALQVAGGKEGPGTNNISVSLEFSFTDAWKYPASSSCQLQLNYILNAN